jgi:AcrR family transcriptional regulator
MDEIAAEAGLSKGSLYRYYQNKQDLFLSLLGHLVEDMEETLDAIINTHETATAKLQMLLDAFSQNTTDPKMLELAKIVLEFYCRMRYDTEANQRLKDFLNPAFDRLTQVIEQGIAQGEFRPVNPRQFAIGLMAVTDGLGIYQMMEIEHFDFAAILKTMIDVLIAGLLKP